jgi:hypothetical protein
VFGQGTSLAKSTPIVVRPEKIVAAVPPGGVVPFAVIVLAPPSGPTVGLSDIAGIV